MIETGPCNDTVVTPVLILAIYPSLATSVILVSRLIGLNHARHRLCPKSTVRAFRGKFRLRPRLNGIFVLHRIRLFFTVHHNRSTFHMGITLFLTSTLFSIYMWVWKHSPLFQNQTADPLTLAIGYGGHSFHSM